MFFSRSKTRKWSFAFEGRIAEAVLQDRALEACPAAAVLLESQAAIEDEIQTALAKALRGEVAVDLEFSETSVEWCGDIEALCERGFGTAGLTGLRQLMGSIISRVLAKHLPTGFPRAYTRVVITTSPWAERRLEQGGCGDSSKPLLLLTLSTICLYVVAIVVLGLIALSLLNVAQLPADNTEPSGAAFRILRI